MIKDLNPGARGFDVRLLLVIFVISLLPVASFAAAPTAVPTTAPTPPTSRPAPLTPPDDAPYRNPDLPVDVRVRDLIQWMTLDEKAGQIQMQSPEIRRLRVPACNWWSEGIHGVSRAGAATVFPQCIGMASSWNPDLLFRVADATSSEARAKADPKGLIRYRGLTYWCPTVNLARDPRWGRVEETYGEDPVLTGRLGVAFVRGLQGDDPKYLKVAATPKHFALHSQETERTRRCFDASERMLYEYYFPAFRECFVEGKAASVMTAFSGINKIPCTANSWLITDVLRKEWGFKGAVVTDWRAVSHLTDAMAYTKTRQEAVTAVLKAGVDVMCDRDQPPLIQSTINAIKDGELTEAELDRSLTEALTVRFRLGMFDPPERVPYSKIPASIVGSPPHMAFALEAARQSMVLLKNEPIAKSFGYPRLLPLDPRLLESVAVLGPNANVNYYGAYSGEPAGPAPKILAAVRQVLPASARLQSARWGDTEAALRIAAESDLAIVVLGLNGKLEHEGIDRPTIDLPKDQQEFIEKILKVNPSTLVVVQAGSPLALNWIQENVPAILLNWYPGEQGAVALAEVITGQCNPSGKLPITFYKSDADLLPLDEYDITKGRTYMYFAKPVLYPFGYGLSYSSYEYKNLRLESSSLASDGKTTMSLDVTNTSEVDGAEIVQLYMRPNGWPVAMPLRRLIDFQRVDVPKGQTRTVQLTVRVRDLAYWDEKSHGFVTPSGTYDLQVGASSTDIRLTGKVEVK